MNLFDVAMGPLIAIPIAIILGGVALVALLVLAIVLLVRAHLKKKKDQIIKSAPEEETDEIGSK